MSRVARDEGYATPRREARRIVDPVSAHFFNHTIRMVEGEGFLGVIVGNPERSMIAISDGELKTHPNL
jgi:hypothetical protein